MLIKIVEFLPVIVFFVSYRLTGNMILATALIVGSCILASLVEFALTRKISRMQIFLNAAVILFGVPTVLLNDPSIIKWKVTVVNLILAAAIFVCRVFLKKDPFSFLLGKEIKLPEDAWGIISKWWMVYFVFAAMLNLVIAFMLPTLTGISQSEAESWWVDYKTFGNAILNFIFALLCGFYLLRKHPELLQEQKNKL